ncbi:MAG TPA: L,D-transpeptidase family protein [Chthoniobacterales bacterium]|nr:L,D-transpeptidase family protein [Chthoniobacterales bacterium]
MAITVAWFCLHLSRRGRLSGVADRIVVEKRVHRMKIFRNGRLLCDYRVALGRSPAGHKQVEGDQRTPEGLYVIDFHKADSDFHRALHISYPNADDIARARRRGISPGGDIMIHGLPNGMAWIGRAHLVRDWTAGCIAVTDGEIDEIWQLIPDGTPIEIGP